MPTWSSKSSRRWINRRRYSTRQACRKRSSSRTRSSAEIEPVLRQATTPIRKKRYAFLADERGPRPFSAVRRNEFAFRNAFHCRHPCRTDVTANLPAISYKRSADLSARIELTPEPRIGERQ